MVYSCTHRLAKVRIINRTGVKIESVNLAHRYSDNYINSKIFADIEPNSSTNTHLIVQYHTGFLCYGTDWWWLTWTDTNNQLHIIEPTDDICIFTNQKPLSHANNKISARSVESNIIEDPTAESGLIDASTCGYKPHMLKSEDDGQYVNIILHPYRKNGIEIQTSSGISTTDYSSSNL